MRKIYTTYSHIELGSSELSKTPKWLQKSSNEEICESEPHFIYSYKELVMKVAEIAFYNRDYHVFYRGQHKEYKSDGKIEILPSIFRKGKDENRLELKKRFEMLDKKTEEFQKALINNPTKWIGTSILTKYKEIKWSILQHYEILSNSGGTPLLDLTHSLHVACSFALSDRNPYKTGIIYLFALPALNDSISYCVNQELFIVRLLSFCPPRAERPFFQEGYNVGPFPLYKLDDPSRKDQFDFKRRLIAKFEIPKDVNVFFGKDFKIIPDNILYPLDDKFLYFLQEMRGNLDEQKNEELKQSMI